MKILILGPLDYPTVREDLGTLNIFKNIYSSYFLFEGVLYAGQKEDFDHTGVIIEISKTLDQKEFEAFDIHYGLIPRTFAFDKIVCYNYDVLSAQEAYLETRFKNFRTEFYTTDDITDNLGSIVDVLPLVKPPATPDLTESE